MKCSFQHISSIKCLYWGGFDDVDITVFAINKTKRSKELKICFYNFGFNEAQLILKKPATLSTSPAKGILTMNWLRRHVLHLRPHSTCVHTIAHFVYGNLSRVKFCNAQMIAHEIGYCYCSIWNVFQVSVVADRRTANCMQHINVSVWSHGTLSSPFSKYCNMHLQLAKLLNISS